VPQEDIEALAITRSFDTQGRNWTHLRWDSAITFIDASIDDKEETTDEKTRLGVVRFVGDSQTRELYHAVLRARDLAGLHCPELVLKDSCIDPTGLFNHTWLHYPDGVVNHEQFPHTSVIVLNTGQWSLSWVHGYPESLPSYREKLKGLQQNFKVRGRGVPASFGELDAQITPELSGVDLGANFVQHLVILSKSILSLSSCRIAKSTLFPFELGMFTSLSTTNGVAVLELEHLGQPMMRLGVVRFVGDSQTRELRLCAQAVCVRDSPARPLPRGPADNRQRQKSIAQSNE
jgi:hypothetical protein